jgi:hypothetical protein
MHGMPKKQSHKHPGRAGNNISLDPLTPDDAMRAILKVKLSDVKKLEAEEKKQKGRPR